VVADEHNVMDTVSAKLKDEELRQIQRLCLLSHALGVLSNRLLNQWSNCVKSARGNQSPWSREWGLCSLKLN